MRSEETEAQREAHRKVKRHGLRRLRGRLRDGQKISKRSNKERMVEDGNRDSRRVTEIHRENWAV